MNIKIKTFCLITLVFAGLSSTGVFAFGQGVLVRGESVREAQEFAKRVLTADRTEPLTQQAFIVLADMGMVEMDPLDCLALSITHRNCLIVEYYGTKKKISNQEDQGRCFVHQALSEFSNKSLKAEGGRLSHNALVSIVKTLCADDSEIYIKRPQDVEKLVKSSWVPSAVHSCVVEALKKQIKLKKNPQPQENLEQQAQPQGSNEPGESQEDVYFV